MRDTWVQIAKKYNQVKRLKTSFFYIGEILEFELRLRTNHI